MEEKEYLSILETLRWNGIVTSPFDPLSKVYRTGGRFKCSATNRYFTVRTGTIFQNSRIPLGTWFNALQLIQGTPELSATDLAAAINVSQKTAWSILRKTKKYFGNTIPADIQNLDVISDADRLTISNWFQILKR